MCSKSDAIEKTMNKADYFQSDHYQRHNQRRQEHLATLGLPLTGKSVLEIGAAIGDHTSFFLDRKCKVTSTDGRTDLLSILNNRYPSVETLKWDVEASPPPQLQPHQIVYCYGLLYHVSNPEHVLQSIAALTTEFLLLETCVSFGTDRAVNLVDEYSEDPTQALSGMGCRPTRPWIFDRLKAVFPYVYLTKTQPWHEEFPVDWSDDHNRNATLSRSVFVASRHTFSLTSLSDELLMSQHRC